MKREKIGVFSRNFYLRNAGLRTVKVVVVVIVVVVAAAVVVVVGGAVC